MVWHKNAGQVSCRCGGRRQLKWGIGGGHMPGGGFRGGGRAQGPSLPVDDPLTSDEKGVNSAYTPTPVKRRNSAAAASGNLSEGRTMNEDTFNKEIRKFLKKVGITSQREIEKAVWARLENGELKGNEHFPVSVTLNLKALDLSISIDGDIALE